MICRKAAYFVEKSEFTGCVCPLKLLFEEVASMTIEKNIMATLKREMDKRGVNYSELSAEIDIPRTTLQGYLSGTSHPRADSMENLADKLGISVAELVPGEEPSASAMDFNRILSTVPTLHPKVLPAAQQAASLLKSLFQLSEELYAAEEQNVDTPCPNAGYLYCLHEMRDPFRRSLSYGILVKECRHGSWSTIAIVAPFSGNRSAVLGLIDRCTKLQLDPEHLLDVVQDFLTQQLLST